MNNKIIIKANVSASATKAWQYYTKPNHIVNWNFADPSWQCPWATNDMIVGGKYSARMEAKDGSFGFEFETTYNTIDEGKSFTYTMPDGREVNVNFIPTEDTTEVTVAFDPENQNPIEMQEAGWQSILNNYKKYTEEN